MQEPDGRLGEISIADESIVKITQKYYQNPWGAGMMIQAVSPGVTTLSITVGNTVRSFEIVVNGAATTAATTTTTTTATTTTTTTMQTTTTTESTTTTTGMLGDVNDDRNVDAIDAARILTAAAADGSGGAGGLTDAQKENADVNKSGGYDAADAALILQYAAAGGSGFRGTLEDFLRR